MPKLGYYSNYGNISLLKKTQSIATSNNKQVFSSVIDLATIRRSQVVFLDIDVSQFNFAERLTNTWAIRQRNDPNGMTQGGEHYVQ